MPASWSVLIVWRKKRWPPSVLMYSLPLQSSRWFSHKWVSNLTERIHSICTSLIMLAEEDNTYAKFGAGQNFYTVFPPPPPLHFYCLPFLHNHCISIVFPSSTTTVFLLSSHLHHHYISIVFPPPSLHFYCLPSSTTTVFLLSSLPPQPLYFYCLPTSTTSTFLLSSLLHHHYISIVFPPPSLHFYCLPSSTTTTFLLSSLLHHLYISTVFPPPPSLHFHCLPSSITAFRLSSFLHHHYISPVFPLQHHYISTVFPPPPPLHFYCLSPFTALLHYHCFAIIVRLPPPLMGIWSSVGFAKYTVGSETRSRFFQLVGSCLTFQKNKTGEWSSLDRLAWKAFCKVFVRKTSR